MRNIRRKFVATVEETARTAMGVFYVWMRGGVDYRAFFESTLSATIQLKADENTPIPYEPRHEQVLAAIEARPYIVVETFHGQALQQWYQFLADLYRAGVRAALAGSGAVQLKSVDVRLHLDRLAAKLGATPLDDAFADAARDEFDFSESDTKLKRVAKMFHRSDVMKAPATAAHCSVVRENTLVRNILQHNDGVIRAEDVGQNGGPFTCDTGKATHRLDKGDQVHRTVFDLSTCVQSMVAISNALVV